MLWYCMHYASLAIGFVCVAVLLLQGLYYLFGTAPNPVLGALDFYVAQPLFGLFKKNYDAPTFYLREK